MNSKIVYEKITLEDISSILEFQDIEQKKDHLRQLREENCYIYVNRGEVWYKRLTQEQKEEFDNWYQKWLDVTKTFDIPKKPLWLK
jgi:hypothetical protein